MKNSAGMEVEPTLMGQEGLEYLAAQEKKQETFQEKLDVIAEPTVEDVKEFEEKLNEKVEEPVQAVEKPVQQEIEKTQEVLNQTDVTEETK